MLSIQTNVTSLVAEQNLNVNNAFQSKTIERLTSGYRINSSGDDAAGLAVANQFRSQVAELTQGVMNANDGVGQLQIMDGGLSNISNILDRLKTLATESASTTFTGDRTTLNNEYQSLLGEIDRQATNINLNTGGSSVANQKVYIGGAASASSNAEVQVDLSAAAVDTAALGLKGTSVVGGGVGFTGDTTNLNAAGANFLNGTGNETFTFDYVDANGALHSASNATPNAVTATVVAQPGGYTGQAAVDAVNKALATAGITNITASISAGGTLQFSSPQAFSVSTSAAGFTAAAGSQSIVAAAANNTPANNTGVYTLNADYLAGGGTDQTVNFTVNGQTYAASVTSTTDADATAVAKQINATVGLNAAGVYAIANGNNVLMTSGQAFTVSSPTASDAVGGLFWDPTLNAGAGGTDTGNIAVTAPVAASSATVNAVSAINSVSSALSQLGLVQGTVGAGENQLNYAISLAQSQITNFDSAESQVRDADIATEAANLTKAQVLQQASIAAMAQANSAPQQVLALLRQ